ncbi:hypothetical protein NXH56_07410 [Bifidobacterium thermophilum]|nr:hypothetical protein [Bifidobacterium thermophilum]
MPGLSMEWHCWKSEVLEEFNAYLKSNPRFTAQSHQALDGIFGRSVVTDGEYVPLTVPEIERRLRDETAQGDS